MKTTDFITARSKQAPDSAPVEQSVVEQTMPEFTFESADSMYSELLNETTAGATGSPSIGVSIVSQGNMPTEIIRRQQTYTNQRTKGGTVKVKNG
jgi:hypothetical protein